MEVESSEISYISVYNNLLEIDKLKNMFEVWKTFDYKPTPIFVKNKIEQNNEIRNVESVHLTTEDPSKTVQHYSNLFHRLFSNSFNRYLKSNNLSLETIENISAPDILKYSPGGHYTWHHDSCSAINRSLSAIFFVNEDYEGGELEFNFPKNGKTLRIKPSENSMVVWPSNFMFPHRVVPVTKGVRYSVVCWAV